MSCFEWYRKEEDEIEKKMFSTCFNFTTLATKAFAKLKLFELVITWCD